MKNATLETWVWVLIYGGLLLLSLGAFVLRADPAMGWGLLAAGAVALAVGVVLIAVRARRPRDE
jgi:hypothetical protein